jgi:hypothetical protein
LHLIQNAYGRCAFVIRSDDRASHNEVVRAGTNSLCRRGRSPLIVRNGAYWAYSRSDDEEVPVWYRAANGRNLTRRRYHPICPIVLGDNRSLCNELLDSLSCIVLSLHFFFTVIGEQCHC